jgi:hypothetical protein
LVARFHTAVDLWTTGVTLRRQAMRRAHPEATEREIDTLVNRWLADRPGAEWGDGPRPGTT